MPVMPKVFGFGGGFGRGTGRPNKPNLSERAAFYTALHRLLIAIWLFEHTCGPTFQHLSCFTLMRFFLDHLILCTCSKIK